MILTSDITVKLIEHSGSDIGICNSATISTGGVIVSEEKATGLIGYLIKNRHGSPFEKGYFEFYVEAPIFVFREWHRHRVGWSYNEMSGRYSELEPKFWIPRSDRKMIPVQEPVACAECGYDLVKVESGTKHCGSAGCNLKFQPIQYHTSARPLFGPVNDLDHDKLIDTLKISYYVAWDSYQASIVAGIAKEVARACLPVGIYSKMICTCNPRSLMHFLSLRTHSPTATFVSRPQAEIEEAARQMESEFGRLFPITYAAFIKNGRVAP